MKAPARGRLKCGGRIFILLKCILNIKNVANVILHSNKNKGACSLSLFLFNWEKFKARRGVLCFLCYLTKNYSYLSLNYYYYSIYLKIVECLKNNCHNTGKTGLY